MTRHISIYVLVICAIVSALPYANAQSTDKSSPRIQERSDASGSAVQDEADLLAEARRATALGLVSALADEARGYQDNALRVRIQAQAGEALCETERERARSLFYRAWEAADEVDRAGQRRVEEDRQRFFLRQGGGPTFIAPPPNLRLEVLRFAARCDRELSEKLLDSIEKEKKDGTTDNASDISPATSWDPTQPSIALKKRLELGILLLERGDIERALRFTDPALTRVTQLGIVFLYKLRQKDAAAADQRFAALLLAMADDPSADANTISLLSSYAFTPLVFAIVTRNGRLYGGDEAPAPVLSAELRAAFFRTAAQVLMRPLPPPDRDFSSAGRAGTYFVIARLLPLFQQYAPSRVPELSAHLASLTQDAPASLRNDNTMLTIGFNSAPQPGENLQAIPDQLRRATSSDERDRIYVGAVRTIAKTDPSRAREFADKIENAELRKRAITYVDLVAIRIALDKKNPDEALRITRAGNLPFVQRVWAYTEVIQLLKTDPGGIVQILNEATADARRIEQNSAERAQAFTAIATRSFVIDRARAWEAMVEAVKAANRGSDFKGDAGKVAASLWTEKMVAEYDYDAPTFDLNGIFNSLAKDDLHRSIDLAKSFSAEEPRAIAIFAIARSILEEKPKRADQNVRR